MAVDLFAEALADAADGEGVLHAAVVGVRVGVGVGVVVGGGLGGQEGIVGVDEVVMVEGIVQVVRDLVAETGAEEGRRGGFGAGLALAA